MSGLLYKDLINLKQQGKLYLLIIGVWLAVSYVQHDVSFFGGMMAVFGALITMTSCAYDEKSGWDKYALAMPVGRRALVWSKYALALLMLVSGLALYTVLSAACRVDMAEYLEQMFAFLSVGCWMISLILPLIFRFGVEKGRVSIMIAFFCPVVIIGAAGNLPPELSRIFVSEAFVRTLQVLGFLLLPLSAALSMRIYRKKEF